MFGYTHKYTETKEHEKLNKSAKNIMIGCGIASGTAVIYSAVSYTLRELLVRIALERKGPDLTLSSRRSLAGSVKEAAFVRRVAEASKRLRRADCSEVHITGSDGTPLVGHYRKCDDPKRIIVAMHGWRSSWSNDFGAIADFWHNSGCNVLYAEQRGQGSSGGDYMGFGLLERYDCLDWVNWVNDNTDRKLPVYLGGISMGASTVLMTAGLDLPENVRGIIADCGFTSPNAIWRHVVQNNMHIPYGIHSAAVNSRCRKRIKFGGNDYSCTDAMKVCKIPVLFIHGTDDRFVPVEMTYENYKACASKKYLLVVPGASHGESYFKDTDAYEAITRAFWTECEK